MHTGWNVIQNYLFFNISNKALLLQWQGINVEITVMYCLIIFFHKLNRINLFYSKLCTYFQSFSVWNTTFITCCTLYICIYWLWGCFCIHNTVYMYILQLTHKMCCVLIDPKNTFYIVSIYFLYILLFSFAMLCFCSNFLNSILVFLLLVIIYCFCLFYILFLPLIFSVLFS